MPHSFSEEYKIKPSVWGTEKWYGGYEVYKINKYGSEEKVAAIKPSVWGKDKWYGGYELETKNKYGIETQTGRVKPSVWGTDKWYGGYDVQLDDKKLNPYERANYQRLLETILAK